MQRILANFRGSLPRLKAYVLHNAKMGKQAA